MVRFDVVRTLCRSSWASPIALLTLVDGQRRFKSPIRLEATSPREISCRHAT